MRNALRLFRGLTSPAERSTMLVALISADQLSMAECACCGFKGRFDSFGRPIRVGVMCPSCRSLERHRLFHLVHGREAVSFADADVLHFAPERFLTDLIKRDGPRSYTTADIEPGRADLVLNLEAIERPDASYDLVVGFHVLEHVNDTLAMAELFRILRPKGRLIAMVPLVEGWRRTYENPAIVSDNDRLLHFGQEDHVRFYGADFRDRLAAAGFEVDEHDADGGECVRYGLHRGEKVFVAAKP
jgi:SAM-dependent methyltransferase